ncbi:alpha/beta fold hydrolase [Microbacterium timonense]|jgi:pimeloyl-ACP methyl ester carboxylesterase|uniref:alpha/beta fold hydrolase n=1 Tax=Microbacterium timonense TaxID=2086576 RepID=UPI0013588877|nr:alpha/beta hydrolase [Microbacterium timonense]
MTIGVIERIELEASCMIFDALAAGPSDGEPVLLLHGIPETSAMWTEIMTALATAGYRCVAPDQRGYSPRARPEDVGDYAREHLTADVFGIATAAGFERFHLVAHDWGAAIGWSAVDADKGERIASYTALSIPHYRAFAQATRDDPAAATYREQLAMLSAVDSAFAEFLLADDAAGLRVHLDAHSEALIAEYLSVLGVPGAFDAALNWYRASRGHMSVLDEPDTVLGEVSIPTMLIWGGRDVAVTRMGIEQGRKYLTGPHEFVELDAGHWLAQEEPEIVLALIRRQLGRFPV